MEKRLSFLSELSPEFYSFLHPTQTPSFYSWLLLWDSVFPDTQSFQLPGPKANGSVMSELLIPS